MSRRALLVEDDAAIATVITAALEAEGFAVDRCDSIARRDQLLACEAGVDRRQVAHGAKHQARARQSPSRANSHARNAALDSIDTVSGTKAAATPSGRNGSSRMASLAVVSTGAAARRAAAAMAWRSPAPYG